MSVASPYTVGSHTISCPVIAAPMAGVSDKPYRQVCRANGAGLVVSEMLTSQLELRHSTKSRYRMDLLGEPEPVVVQIVGTDPKQMADAAQFNVDNGAQIIDINMGCPAKKVYKKAAGSALLANEPLVDEILNSVVNAVDVPITLKIRTGTAPESRNALNIATIAENAGVQALTIHGRTRECKFVGAVEYDTIAEVKQRVSIPVIANGDIRTPSDALRVLQYTQADAVMIGRAAQGQPWLFKQIATFLSSGKTIKPPSAEQRRDIILDHVAAIHDFYGNDLGVRLARKHIKAYLVHWEWTMQEADRQRLLNTQSCSEQWALMNQFLSQRRHQLAA